MINIFYSTVTNVGATVTVPMIPAVTEETVPILDEDGDGPQRQEPCSSTSSNNSTAPKCKRVSKKDQYQAELNEHILQMAAKEEDQVDLELAAIGVCLKQKLTLDEIDEVLDQIKDLTREFLNRKKCRQEIASVSVQVAMSTPANAVTVAPPPLQRQLIAQTQEQPEDVG